MKTLTYAAVMLALIAVGAAPTMAQVLPPDAAYNAYGQPNQVYGMPGAGQASAGRHGSRARRCAAPRDDDLVFDILP